MKFREVILFSLLAFITLNVNASADYRLGFCDNTQPLSDRRVNLGGSGDTLEAAIFLSAEELARVSDGSFTGVNVGIKTTYNLERVTCWIRMQLTGDNLASSSLCKDEGLHSGWNAVKFDEPLDIDPDQGYYVGYTMKLNKASGMVYMATQNAPAVDGGCWICTDTQTWEESTDHGILFVEALIQSPSLPQKDLVLRQARFNTDTYSSGSEIDLDLEVYNNGLETASRFDLLLSCEEKGIQIIRTVDCDLPYAKSASLSLVYEMPDLEIDEKYRFTASIINVNGESDENPDDNSLELPDLYVTRKMFDRTVVLEEFTTERCGMCPNAAIEVERMLESMTDKQRVHTAILCHHAGFLTDKFTQPCDNEYLDFYMDEGTYAPGFMVDRMSQTDRAPVFTNPGYLELKDKVVRRMTEQSEYSIQISGFHNADARKVSLIVTGTTVSHDFEKMNVTVYLLENNVDALAQNGIQDHNYKHQHLIRAYNATWGETPEWNDNNYFYKCEIFYPEGCKTNDMEILAILANDDSEIITNREIANSCRMDLMSLKPASVNDVEDKTVIAYMIGTDVHVQGDYEKFEVYDISGKQVGSHGLVHGVYMVRVLTTSGTRVFKIAIG